LAKGNETRELDGRHCILGYPLRADCALVSAHIADEPGNLVDRKTARNFGPIMAAAATTTVVQVARGGPGWWHRPVHVVTRCIYVDRVVRVTAHHPDRSEVLAHAGER
jgi:3-oxoadipate CoA-transferase, alpha subunit